MWQYYDFMRHITCLLKREKDDYRRKSYRCFWARIEVIHNILNISLEVTLSLLINHQKYLFLSRGDVEKIQYLKAIYYSRNKIMIQ